MATHVLGLKLISRYQTLFCCLVIVWGIGIILGSIFLAAWGTAKKTGYMALPDLHVSLKERAAVSSTNSRVQKALKYCSPLTTANSSPIGEGKVRSRHKLEAVAVVMRHGDRGPMQYFRNLSSINCGVTQNLLFSNYTAYMDKHGSKRSSRDPFRHFGLAPKNSSCFAGHLSQWGLSQHLQTGRLLSQTYIKSLKLLRSNWRPEEVVFISTMMERTYQSAMGFAFGFLPNFDITKLSFKIGMGATFCYSQQFCRCQLMDKLRKAAEAEKYSMLSLHQAVQDLVEQADSVLSFQKLYNGKSARPDDVFDKLLVYVCHGVDLPCQNENACITVDQLANIISFLEWRGKRLSESFNVKLLSRLSMQGFLTDLLQRFNDVVNGKKKAKFIFFSAHDNTLMPLLLSMGIYDGVRPPYSSRLVFELHSFTDEHNLKVYHLKVVYNGKDVTKRLPFCCKSTAKVQLDCKYCLLKSFSSFVESDYLLELNSTSFKQACMISSFNEF